jgi:hypothetical protein
MNSTSSNVATIQHTANVNTVLTLLSTSGTLTLTTSLRVNTSLDQQPLLSLLQTLQLLWSRLMD